MTDRLSDIRIAALPRDHLTGAYASAALAAWLHDESERARAGGQLFALCLLDLDHFAEVNKVYGRARGDGVLCSIVRELSALIRETDTLFRYGGDEFLLVLPGALKSEAAALAGRLLRTIRAAVLPGEPPLSVSLSAGVAAFPQDALHADELLAVADQRVQEAKRRGRGLVIASDPPSPPDTPSPAT
jgi:diguanylate cyclase (GGDEF)-like protein